MLSHLFESLRDILAGYGVQYGKPPVYRDFRAGDVRHSQADVSKARELLGYEPPRHSGRPSQRDALVREFTVRPCLRVQVRRL